MKISARTLFAATVFSFTTMSAFASYPMICRGGGTMHINTNVQLFSVTAGVAMQPTIDIFFTKSASPAGEQGENLKPGECSWMDRAIYPGEPSAISDQYLTGKSIGISSQQSATGTKVVDVTSLYSPLSGPDGSKVFVKLWVGNSGVFMRDAAQPVNIFVKP